MEHKRNCGISFLIMAYKTPTVISAYSSDGTDRKRIKCTLGQVLSIGHSAKYNANTIINIKKNPNDLNV